MAAFAMETNVKVRKISSTVAGIERETALRNMQHWLKTRIQKESRSEPLGERNYARNRSEPLGESNYARNPNTLNLTKTPTSTAQLL